MFLPLLKQWQQNKGVDMIGKLVYVWTSNNKMHTYRIIAGQADERPSRPPSARRRTGCGCRPPTGPNYTYPKLVVKAQRISTVPSTYDAAHPTARTVKCG